MKGNPINSDTGIEKKKKKKSATMLSVEPLVLFVPVVLSCPQSAVANGNGPLLNQISCVGFVVCSILLCNTHVMSCDLETVL